MPADVITDSDKCTVNETCPICPHNGNCAEVITSKSQAVNGGNEKMPRRITIHKGQSMPLSTSGLGADGHPIQYTNSMKVGYVPKEVAV